MSESQTTGTASELATDAEQLAADAGVTVGTEAKSIIADTAEVLDLATATVQAKFGVDLPTIIGGVSLLIVGVDRLVTAFKTKSTTTASTTTTTAS